MPSSTCTTALGPLLEMQEEFRHILFLQGFTKNMKKIADSTNQSPLLLGPFSVKPLEEAGFKCPKLNFALRNPVKIAEYTQRVVQDGPKNSLDRVLRSQISILKDATNMAEGQINETGIIYQTPEEALRAATEKIPHGKYALFFIDNYEEIGIESVSIPAISSGIFGFPKEKCAEIMLEYAIAWCKRDDCGSVK